MSRSATIRILLACFSLLLVADLVVAEDERSITASDIAALKWRTVGPANMGGRVSAIALAPGSRTDFYVGYAGGGVFKTTNLGTTFSEVFRNEATSSIGAIAVADAPVVWAGWDKTLAAGDSMAVLERIEQGRGKIVWIGTGEGNNRNSSSWGHGVYRSTDGGGGFECVGLEDSHDIPALAVHPTDPDVCFVAALGHLWGANKQRGVFRTVDGGATWEHVLKVDENTGACDVLVDTDHPETVYAALYARRRAPWGYWSFSDKAGIWRSDDGGDTWTRLTVGLPERTGRIGLAMFDGDTSILYATVESDQGGIGKSEWDDRSPSGGLFRTDDRGDTWSRVNQLNFRPFYFSRVVIDPRDADRLYMLGWNLAISDDGGTTFRNSGSLECHVDHHALVVDPDDPERLLLGNDGGFYISHDRSETWDFLDNVNVGQFYHVDVDMSDPYRMGGGLQDNGSWVGPSRVGFKSGNAGAKSILVQDWISVYSGDGFRVAFDPTDPNVVYATSQGGNLGRVDLSTKLVIPLKAAADEGQQRLRFNWDAPFLVSAHDPTVLYHGGNKVFKLLNRGDHWRAISGDLTRMEVEKMNAAGSDAETYATLTAIAESPLTQGVLWAGSDDGLIHVTFDEGGAWKDVTPKKGDGLYVAHLEPSHADDRTAYAAVDGHRSDVFRPIVLMTTNGGGKWNDIAGDLPADGPIRVVREDVANPDVLYCGNETAAYVTFDRGEHWLSLGGESLPTVPVYDLKQHPREHDLIAATHGRSLWVLDDVSCFAELADHANDALHVFPAKDAVPRLYGSRGYGGGDRVYRGANPPDGAVFTYWLKDLPEGDVSIAIKNPDGFTVKTLSGPSRPGLNRATWSLVQDAKHRIGDSRRRGPVFTDPGEYTATVSVDGQSGSTTFTVEAYPGYFAPEDRAGLPGMEPAQTR